MKLGAGFRRPEKSQKEILEEQILPPLCLIDCLLVVSPILHDLSPNFASLTPPPPPPLSPGAKLSTLSTWNFIKHSNSYGFSPQTFKFDTSPLTGKTNTEIIAFQNGHFFLSEILIQ